MLHPAASIDLLLALILMGWMIGRARRTLGSPHPGWRWYLASLAVLVLALAVVPPFAAGVAPAALRLFHLHANTLGFITLAALGTLPVLMPTALRQPDSQAAPWLRRRLPVALGGALILSFGAATMWPLSVGGAAFLVVVALGLLVHWLRSFGVVTLLADGVSASLVAALFSLVLLLLVGVAHSGGLVSARGMVPAFVAAFLLPLVTGALGQLLPVWRFPGVQTPARDEMRRRLVRAGRWRAVLFPAAGMAFALDLGALGVLGVAMGLGLFLIDLLQALRVPPPAR
jgi:hypothetical protein